MTYIKTMMFPPGSDSMTLGSQIEMDQADLSKKAIEQAFAKLAMTGFAIAHAEDGTRYQMTIEED